MRSPSFSQIAVGFAVLFLVGSATSRGAVFVQQSHINAGNPATQSSGSFSTQEVSHPGILDTDRAKTWDNFHLSSSVVIDKINWSGSYGGFTTAQFNPNPVSDPIRGEIDFQIEIYSPSTTQSGPGALVSSFLLDGGLAGVNDGADVVKTLLPNQRTRADGKVFAYEASGFDAVQLSPGDYWLSILALQTFPSPHPNDPLNNPPSPNTWIDPSWGWHFGNDGDNFSFNFDAIFDLYEPGIELDRDFSFTLSGDLMGDANHDGKVDFLDVSALSSGYGGSGAWEQGNFNGDATIDFLDVSLLASNYGAQASLAGDANLDGVVDFLDVSALASGLAIGAGGWQQGNFNGDHAIDVLDISLLATNFTGSANVYATLLAISVPEPDSSAMLLTVILLSGWFRRR